MTHVKSRILIEAEVKVCSPHDEESKGEGGRGRLDKWSLGYN